MTNKHTKYISIISAFLVLMIAVFAFILSFDAIRKLAIEHHIPGNIAFMAPFIIDGLMVVLSVSVLRSALLGENVKLSWFFILLFTGVSIAFNIEHSDKTIPGIGFSILYPVSLLIAFESFMHQIRSNVQRTGVILSIENLKLKLSTAKNEHEKLQNRNAELKDAVAKLQLENETYFKESKRQIESELETLRQKSTDEIEQLKLEIEQLKSVKSNAKMKPEQIAMRVIIKNNPDISKSEIGRIIGKAPSTVSNYAMQLNVHKNGEGWEIK